ncbi:uncharacterized protein [Arachis hypogaea]|uniref:uncharacterized protein n=1 Tax=Arachis hypogaea TaxID=3818 RepID=UPI003B215F20
MSSRSTAFSRNLSFFIASSLNDVVEFPLPTKIPFEYPYLNSFSPNQKRKLKQKTLASPPPPQGLPLSVDLRHYHHRLVVRASSSFKNCSFFFLELGASVPGIHLLHRAPAAVRRALSHQRLRLVVADSSNLPLSSELCSSPGLCLHHDSASYSQTAQKKNPSPFQFPSFEFREQKLNQEKNLRLRRVRCDMGSLSSCFVCLDQSRYSWYHTDNYSSLDCTDTKSQGWNCSSQLCLLI